MRNGDDKTTACVGKTEGSNLIILLNLGATISEPLDQNAAARRLNDNALKRPVWRDKLQAPPVPRSTPEPTAVQSGKTNELPLGWPDALCE